MRGWQRRRLQREVGVIVDTSRQIQIRILAGLRLLHLVLMLGRGD